MSTIRNSLLGIIAAIGLSVPAAMANSLTFQNVTFETIALDADTLQFSIFNASNATGNWTGTQYLSAFEIKDIGDVTSTSIFSATDGSWSTNVNNGLSSNVGCTTGGTPGTCVFATPSPVLLDNSMTWVIDFAGTGLNFDAPHVKAQFLTTLGQTKATGDLLSQNVPAIPEPEIYAMMGIGLGVIGWAARRRKQKEAAGA